MPRTSIASGVVHSVPEDLRKILIADAVALRSGKTLLRLVAMSGYVGSKTPRNSKQDSADLKGCILKSKKENGGLVVGPGAVIEKKTENLVKPIKSI